MWRSGIRRLARRGKAPVQPAVPSSILDVPEEAMSGGMGRRLAWAVFGVAIGVEGLSLGLIAAMAANLHREGLFGWPEALAFDTPLVLGFSVMGVAVAIRRPRNPVGWLMLFAGLWFGLQSFAV